MTTARSAPRVALAHAAYALVVHLACLVALAPLAVRVLRDRGHGAWIRRRLGDRAVRFPAGRPIWVHAVSVGEVKASRPLVRALRERFPDVPLVLSTGTLTGQETARRLFPDLCVFAAPLDLPWVVRRTVRRVDPRLLVLLELEVWPAFLRCIDEAGVPQVIVNGRVSESSFRGYRRLSWWLPEFDRIDLVAAQDETYADRIARLGVPRDRIHVTGNLKHDLVGAVDREAARALGEGLGLDDGRPVLVAGSTHDGEDGPAVRAWLAAGGGEAAHLVLVPRHLDRLKDIGRLLRKLGVSWVARSECPPGRDPGTVLVVDTMGELETFFALADVVFLGGSLTPVGGHNVLEPAAAGRPVLVGPYLETCRREADILAAAGGLEVVADEAALGDAFARLLGDAGLRERMGAAARRALAGLQGATDADLRLLSAHGLLPGSPLERPDESATLGGFPGGGNAADAAPTGPRTGAPSP